MNNKEFLREYGRILMRPTTESSAVELFEAYQDYCTNDFVKFGQLNPRDQLPIVYLFACIRDGLYTPCQLNATDIEAFRPETGFQGVAVEWHEFQKYLDFLMLVIGARG